MKIKSAVIVLLSILTVQSCKNDIEINAPWKETAVIYGFLDISTTKQYIRISKTFQTDPSSSPSQVGQIADSLYFDSLQVTLTDLSSSAFPPASFVRTNSIPKESGYFTSDVNYLYTNNLGFKLNSSHVYKLTAFHPSSGKAYYGTTVIVDSAKIMDKLETYTIKIVYDGTKIVFKWNAATNAASYNAVIRYMYTENGVLDSVEQFIASTSENISQFTYNITPAEMNGFLVTYFKDKPSAPRVMMSYLKYVVYSGSADLKYASDLSKPSTILLQVKPEFNNIENGIGVFTSRSTNSRNFFYKEDANTTSIKNLTKNVNGFPQ